MESLGSTQLVAAIRERLAKRRDDFVDFVWQLSAIESPSLVPETQTQVLAVLDRELRRLGWRTRCQGGKRSGGFLVASDPTGDGRPKQLLLGHCDTVWPLETLREMPLQRDGNIIRGPGVFDMKAGLAQIVFALDTLRELQLQPPVAPMALINSDEEIGSHDSEPTIRELAAAADRVLVLEPALGRGGQLKTARKGVGQFTVKVKGKAAHAGLEPEQGHSAILELSYLIQELFSLNDHDSGVTVNVGMVDGGMRPNVVAPDSRAVIDVRVLTQEDARRIEQAILNLKPVTPGVSLEITGSVARPPLERTERNRRLWEVAHEKGLQLGLELEEATAGGASDGNTTSLYTATLDGLGAVGGGAHAQHEFVVIDKTLERTALLALLLLEPALSGSTPR